MQQKNASEVTRKSTSKKKSETAHAVSPQAMSMDMPVVSTAKSSKTKSHVGESSASKGHRRTASSAAKSVAPSSSAVAPSSVAVETVASAAPRAAVATHKAIPHEAIAQVAYSYWVSRGHGHGSADEDWLQAERHLSSN